MKIYLVEDICSPDADATPIKAFLTKEEAEAEVKKMYNDFTKAHYGIKEEPDEIENGFEYDTLNDGPGKVTIHTKHVNAEKVSDIWLIQNRCYPSIHLKGMPSIVASQEDGVKLLASLAKKHEEPVEEFYKRGTERRPDFDGEDRLEIDHIGYMDRSSKGNMMYCTFCLRKVHIS